MLFFLGSQSIIFLVSVGKTYITNYFVKEDKPKKQGSTVGIQFATKIFTLRNGCNIKLYIWDAAGQQKFKPVASNKYTDVKGIFLVFDLTNKHCTYFSQLLIALPDGQQILIKIRNFKIKNPSFFLLEISWILSKRKKTNGKSILNKPKHMLAKIIYNIFKYQQQNKKIFMRYFLKYIIFIR